MAAPSGLGTAGSRTLQQLAREFLPRHQSWASYEEQLVRGAGEGRSLPLKEWSWQRTTRLPLPTDPQREAFLRHLPRWRAGGLIEPGAYHRLLCLDAPRLTRERRLSKEEARSLTWKNPLYVAQYLGPTGRVQPRSVTGLPDATHRRLVRTVHHAIQLGTLPPLGNPYWKYHLEKKGLSTFFAPTPTTQHYVDDLKRVRKVKRALELAVERAAGAGDRGDGTATAGPTTTAGARGGVAAAAADAVVQKLYGGLDRLRSRGSSSSSSPSRGRRDPSGPPRARPTRSPRPDPPKEAPPPSPKAALAFPPPPGSGTAPPPAGPQ